MADEQKKQKKIIRVLATDIDGSIPLQKALRKIKGISFMFSNSVCSSLDLKRDQPVGQLSEDEVAAIEEFVKNPELPAWMLNRRRDPASGEDEHLTTAALDLRLREDINRLKRIRAYRGIRHEQGLPVRGQRTRGSFRTQKSVGVKKKKRVAEAKEAEK